MAPTEIKDISSGPDCGFLDAEVDEINKSTLDYSDDDVKLAIDYIDEIIGSPLTEQKELNKITFEKKSQAYYKQFSAATHALSDPIIDKARTVPESFPFQHNYIAVAGSQTLQVPISITEDRYDRDKNEITIQHSLFDQALELARLALPENKLLLLIQRNKFIQKKLLQARSSYIEQEGWKKHGDTNVFLTRRTRPHDGSDLLTVMLLKMLRKGLERASYEHVKNKTEEVYKKTLDQKAYPFPDIEVVDKLLDSNPTASDILNLQCLISAGLNTITWYDRKTSYGTAKRYVKKAASYVPALNRLFSRRSNSAFRKAAQGTRLQGLTRRGYRENRRTRAANAASFRRKSYRDMQMDDALSEIEALLANKGGLPADPRTVISNITKKVKYFLRHGGEKTDNRYRLFNEAKNTLINQQNREGRTRLQTIFDSLLNPLNVGGKKTKQRRNTQRRKTRRQTLHSRR